MRKGQVTHATSGDFNGGNAVGRLIAWESQGSLR
jgi:hypothetical protein